LTDPRDGFLPPELHLSDDDVLEAVEILAEPDLADGGETDAFDELIERVIDVPSEVERTSGFDGIGTRRESRERALALLYEAEQRGIVPIADIIDQLPVVPEEFAAELVVGVSDHLDTIDARIRQNSVSWPLERMPAIDRALLRLGTYELVHTDVPVGACISEAVELAKRYSTDDSHKFVNGMLARVAEQVRTA